jgi:hypothetical protein
MPHGPQGDKETQAVDHPRASQTMVYRHQNGAMETFFLSHSKNPSAILLSPSTSSDGDIGLSLVEYSHQP